jgi:hypothetical protein
MSSSRHSPVNGIPRDIYKQEQEIESIFRNLVRFGDGARLPGSRDPTDYIRQQKIVGWILIVVLGATSIAIFYLLWLRVTGDCGPYRALCGLT